jgi:hypothetical protein
MGGLWVYVKCMGGGDEKQTQKFSKKHRGSKPFGRPRRKWQDNIKMDLRETGCEGVDWIQLPQHRDQWQALVNTVMNLRVQ